MLWRCRLQMTRSSQRLASRIGLNFKFQIGWTTTARFRAKAAFDPIGDVVTKCNGAETAIGKDRENSRALPRKLQRMPERGTRVSDHIRARPRLERPRPRRRHQPGSQSGDRTDERYGEVRRVRPLECATRDFHHRARRLRRLRHRQICRADRGWRRAAPCRAPESRRRPASAPTKTCPTRLAQ